MFLAWQAYPTLQRYGFSFFTESAWEPDQDVIGIAAVLVGTVSVALVAMFFAFPMAVLMALYISEYAPERIKSSWSSLIDLMAAVPSIVYGLWGFFLIMPHAAELALFLQKHFGWIPIFDVKDTDPNAAVWDASRYVSSAFCAGIAVSMMVMPMACAVMRQVFSQTPPGEKEAALALGATKWGMITSVVLPFGRGGIIGGTMLGLGRALGETIAVILIVSPSFDIKPQDPRDRHHDGELADRRPLRRGEHLAAVRPARGRVRAVHDHPARQHARLRHREPQPLGRGGRMTTPRNPDEGALRAGDVMLSRGPGQA